MQKWYVKNSDGKVFGPVDDDGLLAWTRDGRIEPFAGLSNDLTHWSLASLKPELEMDWLIENEPGRFYGPTHRSVVDDLVKSGSLNPGCRIYRDDKNGADRAELQRQMTEKDAALAAAEKTLAERDAALAAAEKTLAERDAALAAAQRETEELKRELAHLTETKQREWKTEVIVPEVVSAEPPPPAARDVFTPGRAQTLADLERQAQSELARMGAANVKRLFGFKR